MSGLSTEELNQLAQSLLGRDTVPDGWRLDQRKHYESDQILWQGFLNAQGKKEGLWQWWYDNREPWQEGSYNSQGNREGFWQLWHFGEYFKGHYSGDKGWQKVGEWVYYNESGKIIVKKETYGAKGTPEAGKLLSRWERPLGSLSKGASRAPR